MKRIYSLFVISTFVLTSFSQIPNGYYDSAANLTGEDMRTALSYIIDNHSVKSYNSLWTYMQDTDKKANGKVWDMYSTRADGSFSYEYTFVTDQCGNYSGESSCYNREHSFPKSWFGDASPMKTDLFHLYPTDGYVNGRRSNYPFGEVGSATWTSTNGSKVGGSNYPGYTGIVFEPIDEYKGDFARTYFYMLTRYKSNISSWNSAMLSGNNFSDWARNLLLSWNAMDPVSDKETERNDEVHDIQYNRNPFIDHPEWVATIWDPNSSVSNNSLSDVKIWYADERFNWELNTQAKGTIDVYNIVGEKISTYEIDSKQSSFQLNLKKGIYIADFKLDSRRVLKFIVD